MPMQGVDVAYKPELLTYCHTQLGHDMMWLKVQNVDRLRHIARNDIRYTPGQKWEHKNPPGEPLPAPAQPATKPTTMVVGETAEPVKAGKMAAILDALSEDIASSVLQTIRPEVQAMIEGQPREITLKINVGDEIRKIDMGIAHKKQPTLFRWSAAGVNVYLHGPAGSGKTTAGKKLAKMLSQHLGREIKFYALSASETMQVHDLLGYPILDGKGSVFHTDFRKAWEGGYAVFLLDEMDTCPALITVLNMALDSSQCSFPDGMIERGEHFYFVGGGNTIGKGAMDGYQRNAQDNATINRFAFVEWDYDTDLEMAAAVGEGGSAVRPWVEHVQKMRRAHRSLGASAPDILISPRASIYGARMLKFDPATTTMELEDALVWQAASEDDRAKVRGAMGKIK